MVVYLEGFRYFVENDLEEEFEELRAWCKELMERDYVRTLLSQTAVANNEKVKQVKYFVSAKWDPEVFRQSSNLEEL